MSQHRSSSVVRSRHSSSKELLPTADNAITSRTPGINALLAPELIALVLELGAVWECDSDKDEREHYQYLRTACLVCRSWDNQARKLLWRKLRIYHRVTAELILDSPSFRQFQTYEMDIQIFQASRITSRQIRGLLAGVQGLRCLELWSIPQDARLDLSIFCSSNLSSLKSLGMRDCYLPSTISSLAPPFSLRQLELHSNDYLTPLNCCTFFSSLDLKELRLSPPHLHPLPPSAYQLFSSVAHQLSLFAINSRPPSSFISAFASCHRLIDLTLEIDGEDLVDLARLLPTDGLEHLTILSLDNEAVVWALAVAVELPAFAKLNLIRFETSREDYILNVPGGEELLQELEKRGCRVEFSDTDELTDIDSVESD